MFKLKNKANGYVVFPQTVTRLNTNCVQRCLTSVIERQLGYSTWNGR